jgi:hypothetical protein
MYASEIQSTMTDKVLEGELDQVTIGITPNENAIIVRCEEEEIDAAYTAEEARTFADALEEETEDWEIPPYPMAAYLRQMAKVIDNEKRPEDVKGAEHNTMYLENYV